jgi:tRNA pseudouridine65 synthase
MYHTQMTLEIIFQDEHYIAINKPSGLLVHRSPIDRHETRFALQMLRDQIGQRVYPVHRLDKPTSGVLLFGLSSEAASTLHQHFSDDSVKKHYLAIVRGHTPDTLKIDHPVKAIDDKYDPLTNDNAKEALTLLTTLARCELPFAVDKYPVSRYSLVKLSPITGRRHQLRYHMKHISHPIIGDAKYGKSQHNRFFREHLQGSRLLLAATDLHFTHPFTHAPIHIQASPGNDFMQVVNAIGWQSLIANREIHRAH